MSIERQHANSYQLATAMLLLSVTVCEMITFELNNILDWNFYF